MSEREKNMEGLARRRIAQAKEEEEGVASGGEQEQGKLTNLRTACLSVRPSVRPSVSMSESTCEIVSE